jgi:hypothetical protein
MTFSSHFEFRSDFFPADADEEGIVNPGCYGRKLAHFLFESLAQRQFLVTTPIPEDWGWVIPVKNDDLNIFIGCGSYEEYENGFLVFINPDKPVIRKLFRKIETTPIVTPIIEAAYGAVENSGLASGLRWWTAEDFGSKK